MGWPGYLSNRRSITQSFAAEDAVVKAPQRGEEPNTKDELKVEMQFIPEPISDFQATFIPSLVRRAPLITTDQ